MCTASRCRMSNIGDDLAHRIWPSARYWLSTLVKMWIIQGARGLRRVEHNQSTAELFRRLRSTTENVCHIRATE
jgi:hypothetical protein